MGFLVIRIVIKMGVKFLIFLMFFSGICEKLKLVEVKGR